MMSFIESSKTCKIRTHYLHICNVSIKACMNTKLKYNYLSGERERGTGRSHRRGKFYLQY